MADWYDSTFTFCGPPTAIAQLMDELGIDARMDSCKPLLNTLLPLPPEIERLERLASLERHDKRPYFAADWKEKNWGVDRDESHENLIISTNLYTGLPTWGELSITISTAWSTPDEAPRRISARYPWLSIAYISDSMREMLMDEITFEKGCQVSQAHKGVAS